MSYLNDVYYTDPNKNQLYKLTNDAIDTGSGFPVLTATGPRAICVSTNMIDVWVVNTKDGTISQYQDGKRLKDIMVGNNPMGICQAIDGAIYVTNFGSNTVSKIVNGTKVDDIPVGNGPRGICCDTNNNIYVSNFISNTITRITNGICVNEIPTALSPCGIVSNSKNEIFVACTASNIVTKIYRGQKVADINVGKVPTGICCDGNDNIWVSNFGDGTVTKIVGLAVDTVITVGSGPKAISCNEHNEIYVMNYHTNTISKIANNKKIDDIECCFNPSGFGDFIGYQAYRMYNISVNRNNGGSSHSGSGTGTTKKITIEDLDPTLRNIIEKIANSSAISDDQVSHDDPVYNTVKKALDHLLYTPPKVTMFNNSVTNAEVGQTIDTITFNWQVNKKMDSLSINNNIGTVPVDKTSYVANNLKVTQNTTYTLTATDSTGTKAYANTSITFLNRMYYGTSASNTITDKDFDKLSTKLATACQGTYRFNCGAGCYIVFAVPTSFGLTVDQFTVGGFSNSDWAKTTVVHKNKYGASISYDIFVSNSEMYVDGLDIEIVK